MRRGALGIETIDRAVSSEHHPAAVGELELMPLVAAAGVRGAVGRTSGAVQTGAGPAP